MINHYKANPEKDEYQELEDGIVIYPSTYFCLDLPKNYAAHHFVGTWHERDTPNPFKDYVHAYHYLKNVADIEDGKKEIHNAVNNLKIITADEILNQFPLKMLFKHILKRIKT